MNGMYVRLIVATLAAATGGLAAAVPAGAAEPTVTAAARHADIDWLEAAANRNAERCSPGQMFVRVFYAVNQKSTAANVKINVRGKTRVKYTEQVRFMERGWLPGDQTEESYLGEFAGCVTAKKRGDVKVTLTAVGGSRSVSDTIPAADRIWGC